MIKKRLFLFLLLVITVFLPGISLAQPSSKEDTSRSLSAFMSYTDLRLGSVQRSIEILASTKEAGSGRWEDIKGLLGVFQRSEEGLISWYMRPDGTYYTVEKGLMGEKLSSRGYFADLAAGRTITGDLVVSKSTGQRSAVIAVPVKTSGKIIGAVGATLFLDRLSGQVSSMLDLPPNESFYALAPNGLTTLHSKTGRHFLDPRELGSETLKEAADEMLSKDSGEVTYEFDNATKKALYRTSPVTRWIYVIAFDINSQ